MWQQTDSCQVARLAVAEAVVAVTVCGCTPVARLLLVQRMLETQHRGVETLETAGAGCCPEVCKTVCR